MAWKVGNGKSVKNGLEPWLGCGQGHRLPMSVHDFLAIKDIKTLHQVDDPNNTNLWHQGWKNGY